MSGSTRKRKRDEVWLNYIQLTKLYKFMLSNVDSDFRQMLIDYENDHKMDMTKEEFKAVYNYPSIASWLCPDLKMSDDDKKMVTLSQAKLDILIPKILKSLHDTDFSFMPEVYMYSCIKYSYIEYNNGIGSELAESRMAQILSEELGFEVTAAAVNKYWDFTCMVNHFRPGLLPSDESYELNEPQEKKRKVEEEEEKKQKAEIKRFNLITFSPEHNKSFKKVKIGSKSHEMLMWLVEQKFHLVYPEQDISLVPYKGDENVNDFFKEMKEANKDFKHYMANCSSSYFRKMEVKMDKKERYIAGWVLFYINCKRCDDFEYINFNTFLEDSKKDDCFTFYTCFVL
jgi:hypothetical protein